MFRSITNITSKIAPMIGFEAQQTRNAFVLKRRWPCHLHKLGFTQRKLKNRDFVYDLVKNTDIIKRPKVKVILTSYVPGQGDVGDILEVGFGVGYKYLLLPGLAVYCTPENLNKYKSILQDPTKKLKTFSSPFVESTLTGLSRITLPIHMNSKNPWVLEPKHLKIAFRNNGFEVPEYTIKLPDKEIQGPDKSLEEKEFLVTVMINKTETVDVRCRIFHWGTGDDFRELTADFGMVPREPLFPEQAEKLSSMPLHPLENSNYFNK